jgi:hypothetical protein
MMNSHYLSSEVSIKPYAQQACFEWQVQYTGENGATPNQTGKILQDGVVKRRVQIVVAPIINPWCFAVTVVLGWW